MENQTETLTSSRLYVRPEQVLPNPKNPRFITDAEFERLVQSIINFPEMLDTRPVVVVTSPEVSTVDTKVPGISIPITQQHYIALGGNMRSRAFPVALERLLARHHEHKYSDQNADDIVRTVEAMKILERGVPIMVVDHWTEEQRREFIIKDNLGYGQWDFDAIANDWDVPVVQEWGLQIPGFDQKPTIAEPEEDEYNGTVPVLPKTVTGDLYELNGHRLLCGDAMIPAEMDRLFTGAAVDLVFTDPPYGVSAGGGRTQTVKKRGLKPIENDELRGDAFRSFLEGTLSLIPLKDEGSYYVCYDQKAQKETIEALENIGFTHLRTIVWNKNVFGLSGHKGYRPKYELIAFGMRGETYAWHGGNDQADVWDVPRPKERFGNHPTPKPIELPARAIKNSTLPGEAVADTFGGSGSTLMASEQLDRRAYILEKDCGYCDYMVQRWVAWMQAQNKAFTIKRNGVDITKEGWVYA